MKNSEIMVEDWVRCKADFPEKKMQRKIAMVIRVGVVIDVATEDGLYYEGALPAHLEGVELSSDILITSGWYVDKQGFIVLEQEHPERVAKWNPETHMLNISVDDSTYNQRRRRKLLSKYADYVHDLQNDLRICDIDKEVNLEK